MSIDEKIKIIADTLNVDEGTINADTVLASLEEWDSMGKISVAVMFDRRYGKELDVELIPKFQLVRDILDLME